jgi:hypothetical protein
MNRPGSQWRVSLSLAVGLLGACRQAQPPSVEPRSAAALDPTTVCMDAATHDAKTNRFGDPLDTAYAGGSPLFDEATGRTLTRWDYIARHHPEIAAKCPRDH